MKSENKQCQNCKQQFVIEPEDFDFYKKIKVPAPTWCPPCRYQRRLANRNEWNFYKRNCSLCGKSMISIYNPEYPGPVYCQRCWWSDKWDVREYGIDFDFFRGFFKQFSEQRLRIPRIAITNTKSVNSEYTNQASNNKNCYMIVASNGNEDCLYGNWYQNSKDSVDCYSIEQSELLYESLNCVKCSWGAFLEDCNESFDSYFLKDCKGCQSCFCCYGLRNQSYYWCNEKLTKEEYKKRLKTFAWTHENIFAMREALHKIELGLAHKYYRGHNNLASSGDYINDNKRGRKIFNCRHTEDIAYCQDAWNAKDCMDMTETLANELNYELEGCAEDRGSVFISKSWTNFDCLYSELCFSSDNLFGCIAMKKNEYCIFNKQYSKDEYLSLKDKLIVHLKKTGEWGEFFSVEISTFAYNETVAQDYFPLSQEQIKGKGWKWYRRETRNYQVTKELGELPVSIADVDENILDEVIRCENQNSEEKKKKYLSCATAFRIIKPELDFYRKAGLPLPRKCFPCRRQDRLGLRNPRQLWHRQCMCDYKIYKNTTKHIRHPDRKCPNEFETTYAPERKEIVYCEKCYQSEVV